MGPELPPPGNRGEVFNVARQFILSNKTGMLYLGELRAAGLQAEWLFDFQPLDRPLSIRAELPVLQSPGFLGMVCTETCPGHR